MIDDAELKESFDFFHKYDRKSVEVIRRCRFYSSLHASMQWISSQLQDKTVDPKYMDKYVILSYCKFFDEKTFCSFEKASTYRSRHRVCGCVFFVKGKCYLAIFLSVYFILFSYRSFAC